MNKARKVPDSNAGDPDRETIRRAAMRVIERCDALAKFSEESDRLTRTFCCEAMRGVHGKLREWMLQSGMTIRTDALGNVIGRYSGVDQSGTAPDDSKIFLIGSHLDSVVDAGRFDGPLGVLLGLAAVELLCEANIQLPFALDVIGFSEEEGVRFNTPFLGSRAIAGCLDEKWFDLRDANGCTIRQALIDFGANPDELSAARYSSQALVGFLEPHIEQGPLLEHIGEPVGVVAAVAGQTRATLRIVGRAGHAGTVPHEVRHDALAAAAECILMIESLGQQTDGLFATVGDISVDPNVANVIPGEARLRLDLRHENDKMRLQAYATIQDRVSQCVARRGVDVSTVECEHRSAIQMDTALTQQLQKSCRDAGHSGTALVSGAGHDAIMMANVTPTCMLFLRCRGGVSHHPDEAVELADVETALDVMVRFLVQLNQPSGG